VTRPVPLALGLVALAAGLVLAGGGVGGGLLTNVGFALAGVAAGIAAILSLLVRSVDSPETLGLGRPPDRPGVRTPGDDLDRKLAAAESGERLARDDLRERAERAVTDAVARRRDCSRERAGALVERGEWTDDDLAAALFTETRDRPSLRDRVRVMFGGESTFGQRFARATAALWELVRR